MADEIYLDNNATTRPLPEVVQVVAEFMGDSFGNASSSHTRGERCRQALWQARAIVAEVIGTDSETITFTSCGTEANNMVLKFITPSADNITKRLVTTTVEHSSIMKRCAYLEQWGCEVIYLPVDANGLVSVKSLEKVINEHTALVSIQWVNSETGVIQPIEALLALCHERGVPFHTDAAQAVGKMPVSVQAIPVDFLTFTGHKFHGPQGTGVVYARHPSCLQPLLYGGDQEMGHRAGTENLPAIAGLGKALEIRHTHLFDAMAHMRFLRDHFESQILDHVEGACINGHPEHRICNTSNIRFPGIDGQALLAQLDQRGIYCSQSSACTNHRPEPSYVLRAMGLSEDEAYASVRFSFSILNTLDDVDRAVEQIIEINERLSRLAIF